MAERAEPQNKVELLSAIGNAWADLQISIARYSEGQLTGVRDAAGWSAKDHLAHLAAWERSMLQLIREGTPQYEGLGTSRELFEAGDYDPMNAELYARTKDRSLAAVMDELRSVHEAMVALIQGMSERDLTRSCSDFAAEAPDVPLLAKLNGNTWSHFGEHRIWIEELIGGRS